MFDHIFQVLDQELAKATRVIEKSKKISEVQVIHKSFARNALLNIPIQDFIKQ